MALEPVGLGGERRRRLVRIMVVLRLCVLFAVMGRGPTEQWGADVG